jgi:predicted dehydrogenase
MRVGIIGCGNIMGAYVTGCRAFDILEVVAIADIQPEAAAAKAAKFNIPRALPVEDLLADPDIDIVINLTVPKAHAEVSLAIIEAGKHLHSEKPLALNRKEGAQIIAAAKKRGVMVGCAPDTFLGGGLQTCRHLLDQGDIGEPVAATAFFMGHGPESWHPNPDFFYKTGAGPMFDLGPYYLSALVHLLGPVRRVSGSARISFPERTVTSEARYGQRIEVEVPTHVAATLDFAGGPVATLITSFDIWAHTLPRIEVYGSEGTITAPDPNTFWGPVKVRKAGEQEWREVGLSHSDEVGRGVGVADLAYAIVHGRAARASGELGYHVLDLMESIIESSESGRHIQVESSCQRPAALPLDLPPGVLDP